MRAWAIALLLAATACGSAPEVPEGATSLRDDVFVQPLRPGVWRHVSFRRFPAGLFPSNGLIVRSSQGAMLIDTAWNPEQTAVILDFAEANVGPVAALVATHSHDDRTGGLSEVHRRGVPSIALRSTAELTAKAGGPTIVRSVASGFRLDPYGVRGEIFFPGAGHSPDNAVVFLEESRVLAGTCMVRSSSARSLGNLDDADLDSWPGAIEAIKDRYPEAEWIVPGHGLPGGRELLEHTSMLLTDQGR